MKENNMKKKQIRTKRTNKLKVLRINHKKVETEPKYNIKPFIFNSWHIKSFTDDKIYIVAKSEMKECAMYSDEFTCSLPCTICKTCFHDFICSCHDHCIRNNMCKHIHAVGMYNLSSEHNIHLEKDKGKNNLEMAQDKEPTVNHKNQDELLDIHTRQDDQDVGNKKHVPITLKSFIREF
ncbi:unnamed protein product [Macrosiphum euphorbiae]|uniref:SWIM-type domain-containing protein n=1 Tax=Macrosiphum euphorbiae TaxID=13131 RepID=A0AAV0Y798_9HEMI|nr:unnamed protein product [Macrosiphum euphorbiae]